MIAVQWRLLSLYVFGSTLSTMGQLFVFEVSYKMSHHLVRTDFHLSFYLHLMPFEVAANVCYTKEM